MLEFAKGESVLAATKREGVVWKCLTDPTITFKVISDDYLLNEKD